ncbi:MAG: serine/threonine protein kinase, partial [Planctomycetales bacterium]|nr:serine/threonine protein kinase [Planctomycetales bacterium]
MIVDDDDLLDAVVEEFTERCRAGRAPAPSEYTNRYPQLAEQLNELLPTIAAIEQTKSSGDLSGLRAKWGDVPERLGDFRIVREIGRGGMGIVYEAVQESLGRTVALKVLPPQMLADTRRIERFEQESRIAARLHHTNIVPVFGVGCDEGLHYYVMQRIQGVGWDRKLLHADQRPTPETVARIGRDAARALQQAHEEGTLHRDVKPGNILIGDDGHVWLTDFGLAQVLESDATATTHVAGTLRYLPPERFHGVSDARGDVYSLGVTLFEAAAGRPPFEARSNVELMNLITRGEPASLRKLDGRIPRDFETIIHKATAREPRDRYVSAAALADDLQRFLDGVPVTARRVGPFERAGRWCGRNRLTASALGAAAMALVLLAVVSTIGYWRTSRLNEQLSTSFGQEQASRRSAESTTRTALEALDTVFERFAPLAALTSSSRVGDDSSGGLGGAATGENVAAVVPNISPQTAAALEALLPFYAKLASERDDDPRIRRQAAAAMHRIGLVQARVGRFEQAREIWNREADLLGELATTATNDQAELQLARAVIDADVGDLERMQDRTPDAVAAYRRALESLETLTAPATAPSFEARRELARVHLALADRRPPSEGEHRGPHGPGRGPPHFGRPGAAPNDGLGPPDGFGPPPGMGRLPPGFEGLPGFDGPPGFAGPPPEREASPKNGPPEDNPEVARRHLDAAFALLTSLSKERSADVPTKLLLARAYRLRSRPDGPGLLDVASPDLKAGSDLLRELCAAYPDVPDYAHELSVMLSDMNPRDLRLEQREVAEARLREALAISEKLVATYPATTLFASEQPHILNRLAALLASVGNAQAEAVYKQGVEACARLTKQFPDEFVYAYFETKMRQGLARYLADAGRKPEAMAEAERAAAIIRPYAQRKDPPPPSLPLDDQLRRMIGDLRRGR